jgi:hypothetical protein
MATTIAAFSRRALAPNRASTVGTDTPAPAAAAVAEAGGGVAQVEAAREKLAGGVVPSALDVELHPGRVCGLGGLVRGPVRVPRPGVRRVGGEQVRVISPIDADRGQLGPELIQAGRDQRARISVDGEPPILVRPGVLAHALPAADQVAERDVHQAPVQVNAAELPGAQLPPAHAGDHHQPQVQAQGGAAGAGLGDHLGDASWRGSRNGPAAGEEAGPDGLCQGCGNIPSDLEPVSGFEPLACRLQDGCSAC